MLIPLDINWLRSQFPELNNVIDINKQGSFKQIYSAEHKSEGHVVLKVIRPGQDIENIRREILAAQKVDCTRVPKIYDVGLLPTQYGDCFWFREQRVIGQSVRDLLISGGQIQQPLNPNVVLRLGLHILEALAKAEEVNIVHRDVKPDNLMRDVNGDFWLLDFGIARHLTLNSQTATAEYFGKHTAGYAPVEQFRNDKLHIDARTDLFALGVTLYECATGINPFRQGINTHLDALRNVEQMPLAPLSLPIKAADDFRDLVDAMTKKKYHHRPPTAREALDWMREICDKEQL